MPQEIAHEHPKARKRHRCDVCSRTIQPEETYHRFRLVWDDGPYVWRECDHCRAMVRITTCASDDWVWDEGYSYDSIEEWRPTTVWEARIRAMWHRQWRRRDGDLYPIPTRPEETT